MHRTEYPRGEIARLGKKIYDEKLRSLLEPQDNHKYVVIDVETGEYEVDQDELAAFDRARARRSDAPLYATRVGHGALCRIGGRFGVKKQ